MEFVIAQYDEESPEADFLVKNQVGDFLCYAHPISQSGIDGLHDVEFSTLYAQDIVLSHEKECSIRKTGDAFYSYEMTGLYVGHDTAMVGECKIKLDAAVPGDIKINDYISWRTPQTILFA